MTGSIYAPAFSLHSDNAPAYDIGSSDFAFVAQNIVLSSSVAAAVYGTFGNFIDLEGQVAGNYGIEMQGDGNYALVGSSGYAWGRMAGISLEGSFNTVQNAGQILGASVGVQLGSGIGNRLVNTGTITTIGGHAVDILHSQVGDVTTVLNSGLIDGGFGSAFVANGNAAEKLTNTGTIKGYVFMGQGNDFFDTSKGTTEGTIDLSDGDDTVLGSAGADDIKAGQGNDSVVGNAGNDTIDGHIGKDSITGGAGADRLYGAGDADTFIFLSKSDSGTSAATEDHIADFRHLEGDRIDLHAIDANSSHAGNDAFHWLGMKAFTHHAGDLHYTVNGKGDALLSGDINGDGKADFSIVLDQILSPLVKGDFVL